MVWKGGNGCRGFSCWARGSEETMASHRRAVYSASPRFEGGFQGNDGILYNMMIYVYVAFGRDIGARGNGTRAQGNDGIL